MNQISLSPSKLNLFKDCPRCFFDAYVLKTPRPRGIMASLMSGIDRTIKPFADTYAGKMPPFLNEKIEGVLMPDRATIKKWGNWRTGMRYYDKENAIELYGALDECAVKEDGTHIPVDWKTKGQKPKDDGAQYYQGQLDAYNLMLSATGHKIANIGYLVYLYPVKVHMDVTEGIGFKFGVDVYKLDCDIERAKKACIDAVTCLRGARPPVNLSCEYCLLVERKKGLIDAPDEKSNA